MSKSIKIVIGANYGDEGKGQTSHLFSTTSPSAITIMTNGGPQRGHTVISGDGRRHVFRHLGSGTFGGVGTFYPKRFLLNPIEFCKEIERLAPTCAIPPLFADPACQVTTPYDMMANVMLEESRGDARHGSCGCGIWETVVRKSFSGKLALSYGDLFLMGRDARRTWLLAVRDEWHGSRRPWLTDMVGLDSIWGPIWHSDKLIENWLDDFEAMAALIKPTFGDDGAKTVLAGYQTLVFENGQGLMLDDRITGDSDHSTPSATGLGYIREYVLDYGIDDVDSVEAWYVTRPYLTRHGNGLLPGECLSSEIGLGKHVETNVENENQGKFRYAPSDELLTAKAISKDLAANAAGIEEALGVPVRPGLCITHMDEAKSGVAERLGKAVRDVAPSAGELGTILMARDEGGKFIYTKSE